MENANFRKEHDELTGRALRIVTRPLVKALLHTSLKPNHVTMLSVIPALASLFFLVRGDALIGALLAFLYVMLDATDGQLAREKNLRSDLGKWFDGILGFIFVPFMMLAAAIGLRNNTALAVGAIAALCFPIQFTLIYFFNSELRKGEPRDQPRMELPVLGTWQILRYSYGLALFFPILLLGAILDKIILVLWFFATAGHAFWVLLLLAQFFELQKRKEQAVGSGDPRGLNQWYLFGSLKRCRPQVEPLRVIRLADKGDAPSGERQPSGRTAEGEKAATLQIRKLNKQ